jgi:phage-related holin
VLIDIDEAETTCVILFWLLLGIVKFKSHLYGSWPNRLLILDELFIIHMHHA